MADADANPKLWTVMVYMAGDNTLSEECVYALNEMREAKAVKGKINVVTQFDPFGKDIYTYRYEILKGNTLKKDQVSTWKRREIDSAEPMMLEDFIRWGMADYPATYYMVVLVGHGSGTDDDFLLRDENPPGYMSIAKLQLALERMSEELGADGKKIHILGFDTCLMSMAEVCYQLSRTSLEYIVSSEGFSPNAGWPYRQILTEMSKPGMTPKKVAAMIPDEVHDFYNSYWLGGSSTDQSALVMSPEGSPVYCERLVSAMKGLAEVLSDVLRVQNDNDYRSPVNDALVLAHWETQSYNGEVYVDIYDFCENLKKRYTGLEKKNRKEKGTYKEEAVIEACDKVMKAVAPQDMDGIEEDRDKGITLNSRFSGAAFQFSHGVSVYFPWSGVSTSYSNLRFATETKWVEFLNLYVTKTRRPSHEFIRDKENRATPPDNKGRDGKVNSMRNPPGLPEPDRKLSDTSASVKTPRATARTQKAGAKPKSAKSTSGGAKRGRSAPK